MVPYLNGSKTCTVKEYLDSEVTVGPKTVAAKSNWPALSDLGCKVIPFNWRIMHSKAIENISSTHPSDSWAAMTKGGVVVLSWYMD